MDEDELGWDPTVVGHLADIDCAVLGKRLRNARLAKGLTQREAGGDVMSTPYVSRLEAGGRRPSMVKLLPYVERLGVTVEDMVKPVVPDRSQVIAALDRVDWMDLWWQTTGDDWPVPADLPRRFAEVVVDRIAAVVTPEPVADDRARVIAEVQPVIRDFIESEVGFDAGVGMTEQADRLAAAVAAALPAQRAAAITSVEPGCTCGGMAACPQCQDRDAQRAAPDPRIEAIRALADELRAHAAAERPEDDRWDDGWRAAHRKIDARLRAALGDQPPTQEAGQQ